MAKQQEMVKLNTEQDTVQSYPRHITIIAFKDGVVVIVYKILAGFPLSQKSL